MAKKLTGRKAIWIMVPQGKPVDETIAKLEPLLNPGDILIDGGNSNYKDSHAPPQGSYRQRAFSLWMWAPRAACGD
jgi:6-phosphogluconate dehydrogenase (decarboxylating)